MVSHSGSQSQLGLYIAVSLIQLLVLFNILFNHLLTNNYQLMDFYTGVMCQEDHLSISI